MSAPDELPHAPEFHAGLAWFNTGRPLALADLRGKLVLLEFWSYGRVDCQHDFAPLKELARRFHEELVVVGVHAGRFDREREPAELRAALLRHGVEYPVVQDADHAIWNAYGVRSRPTAVLIDPRGRTLGALPGEIDVDELAPMLERRIHEHARAKELDYEPRAFTPESAREADRVLDHPSKLFVASETTLFVSDTGHHRVLQLEYDHAHRRARIARVFGGGGSGWHDASGESARFHAPRGLARKGRTLYVADTLNHAVRAIDLELGDVRTVAGTGVKADHRPRVARPPGETALRSPWAVWVERPNVYIAMAGSHQVWALEDERALHPLAGNGHEALVDGFAPQASFNQPSDLASDGRRLFVVDAEASAVRAVDLTGKPVVRTLVGRGPSEWGDQDGVGDAVRLQHPMGLAFDGLLHIADSYNHKLKRLDPSTREVRTLAGTGERGHEDGSVGVARFANPEGVAVRNNLLFVADTDNHALRVVDLGRLTVHTIAIV
ncbi:MAG: redoxin domain-containing protein [Planctomycetes bacterium]|nr:redoxin domain-containing protein [Planctomycetota bacterium]